jgi:hypothetical protein
MMWALFGFICAMVGAVLGFLMLALCVAARDNPRMQEEEAEVYISGILQSVIGGFTAFDIQDDGMTRFTFDIKLTDFQRAFGRVPVGMNVLLSIVPIQDDAAAQAIQRRREEFVSRDMDPREAPHA